ncbi:glycerol-3-phosphate dehydrogenase [Acidocella sp. MX-AZ02]|uniref:glycerol-3-phosphate dehydrogenase n=1 Tax=Acidocella sp. MX-AZ02 TaxID=1214225 RepID=UPI00028E5021|nr:glycerol-3-phosphate dehydrogenase [Acidocella sp. MX-AZ02]
MDQAGIVDLLIVGGGVNGAAIARDAAGRGLSVRLLEQHDLAQHTSSASTKLIHGGLRYLEYYEFRLVREALMERERLLNIAPHIIWPLEFVLPHEAHLRPAWMIRAGLFLYDHLAKRRTLPSSKAVSFAKHQAGQVLKAEYRRGFTYADCWVQDSRLVVLNAMDAAERGAVITTRCKLLSARVENGVWQAQTEAGPIAARAMINAAGPWVAEVLNSKLGRNTAASVRLIKGSHIVTKRLYEGDEAFILQNPDGRIVFVVPYENEFSLIGTTDVPFEADANKVEISAEETSYLCECVSRYFRKPITPADVVWSYAGVRPLFDDKSENASAVTRDYVLDLQHDASTPPLLSVFGGKITTSRKLAEHALEKLLPAMGRKVGPSWTGKAPLPGGDFEDFDAYLAQFRQRFPALPAALAHRLVRNYGSRAERFAGADMGEDFGGGISAAEIAYLATQEWARTAEDILWRRSRLGLHVPEGTAARIDDYLSRMQRAG